MPEEEKKITRRVEEYDTPAALRREVELRAKRMELELERGAEELEFQKHRRRWAEIDLAYAKEKLKQIKANVHYGKRHEEQLEEIKDGIERLIKAISVGVTAQIAEAVTDPDKAEVLVNAYLKGLGLTPTNRKDNQP